MSVWISFDEQEPPMDAFVLACTTSGAMNVVRRKMRTYGRGKTPREGYSGGGMNISRGKLLAWMPLPPLPKAETLKGGAYGDESGAHEH